MISGTFLGLIVLNSGLDFASSAEYQVAHAAGAPEALCGSVALSADVRTLVDLDTLWGPCAALWLPLVAMLGAHLGAWLASAPMLPALSSPVVAGCAWMARKGSECS